jgi:asparagine synthase (glutamine-hydrolysing)
MFLCLLSTDGSPVSDVERSRYLGRIRALAGASAVGNSHLDCVEAGEFVAFAAPALVPLRPLWGRTRGLVGVGNVRLDHRDQVGRWGGTAGPDASDLDLVLAAIDTRGKPCVRDILGDFALVVWEARTRTLTAARDAFGVRTLFVGQRGRLIVLSSHLELVHDSDALDEEYVADFLLAGDPGPERTIWADSRAVPQGSILTSHDGRCMSERFWDPFDFEPADGDDGRAQVDQFRALFSEAVRTRLEPNGQTWAELSGGLDSSSIVSMAQTLVEAGEISEGVAGTISIVDELGTADERPFSELVVKRFSLPNAIVANPWPWQEDGCDPPRTDEPRAHYPFFARDRLECDTVRAAGGRVLLSGMGSDHYLYGNQLFIADLVARGHVIRAGREIARWSVQKQGSFWYNVLYDAVVPLLSVGGQRRLRTQHAVPDWIEPAFAQRTSIMERIPAFRASRAQRGRKFAWQAAAHMQELVRWLPRGSFEDRLEMRYPFLYRPLVEFGLRLSPTLRAQPLAPKWILRQGMNGILPEPIRTRSGKGGIDARLNWAFRYERKRIAEVLSKSRLATLGVLRTDQLEAAVDRASRGEQSSIVMLFAALSLETWLFVRDNRWVAGKEAWIVGTAACRGKEVQTA